MKLLCAPQESRLINSTSDYDLRMLLYARPMNNSLAFVGNPVLRKILREKFSLDAQTWDLLTIGLSVVGSDVACRRTSSPDGWTREIDLTIAVNEPDFWSSQSSLIEEQLQFLTTDRWQLKFTDGGMAPSAPTIAATFDADCVSLLSGGLDSLVGAIDLVANGRRPLLVSQVAQGDKGRQQTFAQSVSAGERHLQFNHDARSPLETERSQRARSFMFLTYGALAATVTSHYQEGEETALYFCENGFISINPPLTGTRVGSLSTRTTHPSFINRFQALLAAAGFRVQLRNPYQFKTKGEMLKECLDQRILRQIAHDSTSCGRFGRHGYTHCGHCLPCLIRRAAFGAWGQTDRTNYRYRQLNESPLSKDVLAAALAIRTVETKGIDRWLGASLTSKFIQDHLPYRSVAERGLDELGELLRADHVL